MVARRRDGVVGVARKRVCGTLFTQLFPVGSLSLSVYQLDTTHVRIPDNFDHKPQAAP
jgi:hypothetical protein